MDSTSERYLTLILHRFTSHWLCYMQHSTVFRQRIFIRNQQQSPATVRHLMNIIINITNSTCPGQPAVITADQPVYAVAKFVPWKFLDLYGEDKVVMMLGRLHIEMAVKNMVGKCPAGSGWTDMFLKANVATSGRSESLLKSSHVKRTRYAHEVSLAALHILRNDAFVVDSANSAESLEDWIA